MSNETPRSIQQTNTLRNRRVQWWIASIFVLAGFVCITFGYLYLRELQTLNGSFQQLNSYRQAEVDLAEGFIQVLLADENDLFSRSEGLLLFEQALTSLEEKSLQLEVSDDEMTNFTAQLDAFRNEIESLPDGPIEAQRWGSLWVTYERLQNQAEELNQETLIGLDTYANQLTTAFNWTLLVSVVLLCGIGLGFYRSEREWYDSERRRAESETRYRSVVEDQTELICRYDKDFKLSFVNEAYAQSYGMSPDEIIGKSVLDRIPASDRDRAIAHVRSLTPLNPVASSEHQSILPDNTVRWYQWTDRALLDDAGNIIEYQGVGRDITEARALQGQLNSLHGLILATSTAENLDDALAKSMRLICEAQDWEYGEVWMPDNKQQVLTVGIAHYIYPGDTGQLKAFWEASHDCQFVQGIGIPGRAWSSQTPSWTDNVQQFSPSEFSRLAFTVRTDIHGVVAIPVVDNGEVLAVMVFMALRPLDQDDAVLQLLNTALQQIAPIIRRQQITESLTESEEKYRTLVDNFDGVITIADASGTYLFANEKAWEPFDLAPDERVGKSVYDLFPPAVGDLFVERVQGVINSGKPRVDIDGMQTGSEYRWFRSVIAPLREADGTITRVETIAFDVTDAKRAEQALRESESRLRAIIDSQTHYVVRVDLSGHHTYWNKAYENEFGTDNLVEVHALDLICDYHHDRTRHIVEACISEPGKIMQIELDKPNRAGQIRSTLWEFVCLVDATGAPSEIQCMGIDITDRKRTERILNQTNQRLHILHQMDQMVLSLDSMDELATASLDGLLTLIPAKRASLFKFNTDQRTGTILGLQTQNGAPKPELPRHISMDHSNMIDQEVFGALFEKKYHLIQNLHEYPAEEWENLAQEGIQSILSVALTYRSQLIGGLFIHGPETDFFTPEWIQVATEIADQLAIGISSHEQREQLRRYTAELEERVQQRTAELQGEKERVEAILNNSPDAILLLDDDLSIVQANRQFAAVFGCAQDHCVGNSLLMLTKPEHEATLSAFIQNHLAQENGHTLELAAVRDDGSTFEAELSMGMIQGEGLVCVIRDISERKAQERQLRYYASFQEHISDAVIATDTEFRIQSWNQAAERIYGWTAAEVMGKTVRDVLHTQQPNGQSRNMAKQELAADNEWHNEVRQQHKNGRWIDIAASVSQLTDENGAVTGAVAVNRDITERKAQERQLRYYASFQEYIRDAVIATDMEFRIRSWNKAAERIFGWTAEEVIGRTFRDALQTQYLAGTTPEMVQEELAATRHWRGEVRQKHKSGRWVDAEASVSQLLDEKGGVVGVVSVNHDITERKAAERQLQYHASLQENVSDAVIVTDISFIIQSWNKAAERIYGWTAEEVIGKSSTEIMRTEFSPEERERSIQQLRGQGWWQGEITQLHKDGRVIKIWGSVTLIKDEQGVPNSVVAVNHDITERKQAEEALRQSEMRYRSLFEQSTDGVFILDLNGTHLQVSQHAAEMLGYSPEEMAGFSFRDVIVVDEYDHGARILERLLQEERIPIYERRVRRKDGTIFPVEISVELVRDEQGRPLHIQSLMRDITERKQMEKELRLSEEKFRQLINAAPIAIVVTSQMGDIELVNVEAEALFDYKRSELIGEKVEILVPEALRDRHSNYHGDPAVLQNRLMAAGQDLFARRKDGRVFQAEIQLSTVQTADSFKVMTFIADITERKQIEAELERQRVFLRAVIDGSPNMIFVKDAKGRFVFVNPAMAELFDTTVEALLEQADTELSIPDQEIEGFHDIDQRVINHGETISLEELLTLQTGEVRWLQTTKVPLVSEDGQSVHVLGISTDITERKLAEIALNEKIEDEVAFQHYLKVLHEITIELTQIDDLDVFYKSVVQFGLEKLGFDRVGLGLYDPEAGDVMATYGTDIEGNLVDERGIRYQPSNIALELNVADSEDRFVLLENRQLYTAATREEVTGWIGLSALWSGTENLGWISIDNAVHQQDPPSYLLELLALYSIAVGSLLARKQEQIALAESEARFRSLVEGAPLGITISDAEGVITLVNKQAELMFGQASADLEGQPVELLIDEAHRDQYISYRDAYLHETPAAGTGHIMEVQAVHKDGQKFPVEIQLSSSNTEHGLRLISFMVDITERKEAELTLRESEEKYRHLVETMSGGLAIADEEARFTYVNDRFCEILGRARREIIGHKAGEFVYEEARELYDQQVQNRQEGRRTSYELVVKRKDNTPVHILVSGSALHDREGNFTGSYSIVMDITARKQAELALQNALAKEKELGELKTRFVSMASHEFRTPLATIMAAVETLSAYRHKLSEEKIDQRFDKIKIQVAHLKDIMEDVLMLSRMQARRVEFNPSKLDLDAMCRSVLDEFVNRPDIDHQIDYQAAEMPVLMLDRKLMRQVINNLISNAIKYSPEAETVYVHLDYRDSQVVMTVRDEGIGIPESDLTHLFEPFHRGENVGVISGTGLGLVILKESIDLHGGTIYVESQVGRGTTFTIQIPTTEVSKER